MARQPRMYQQKKRKAPGASKPHPPRTDKKRPQPGARKELRYYGVAACMALWTARAHDIIRIYITEERLKTFAAPLKWAAAHHKAYHIVGDDDLERLTESIHHQGVCILALEHSPESMEQVRTWLHEYQGACLIAYLDGVDNPHNLGAIVRTCAHFGIKFLIGESGKLPKLSPSACRVAEGGAEFVRVIPVQQPQMVLADLRCLGFVIVATAADGQSVYETQLPNRTVLVMGSEVGGISEQVRKMSDLTLSIPGTGNVESLNVSVAFSILAAEHLRQHHPGS